MEKQITSSQSTVKNTGSAYSEAANSVNPSATLFKKLTKTKTLDESLQRPSISYWKDAWLRLRQNKIACGAGIYIILLMVAATFVPMYLDYKYDEQEVWNAHLAPNLGQESLVVDQNGVEYETVNADQTILNEGASDGELIPPGELELIGKPSTVGIVFKWPQVKGAQGYRIYRSIDAETLGIPLEDVDNSQLSYVDTNTLQFGQTYFYRVVTFNLFTEGQPSAPLKITPILALNFEDAQKFNPDAKIGETITTKPHYLGTDYLGRDLLARVMTGARISLFIGFGAPLIYILIGVIYGSISGYFGGKVDSVMMRIAEIVSTVPDLLTVIMLQVFMGSGVTTLIIALIISAWARSAQQIRGETLRLREMEFVYAAKILGTPFRKIISKHVLPNVLGTVIVLLTLAVPQAIFTEAFLSFIGLGIAPPLASWGVVTREGAKVFLTYPHELIIPAALICATMFAFNMLGDGLRDALDPRLRGAK